jgi:polynucleotide 5'-hydroxyl-kinase GRC3/NOL9
MDRSYLDVPLLWLRFPLAELKGTLLVIGGVDTGKTTFARYLFRELKARNGRVAFLDGDPGQSTLGPPTTLTMAYDLDESSIEGTSGMPTRYFIGSISPSGHMLQTLVGSMRLVQAAYQTGDSTIPRLQFPE